jgi:hypothetical protein
MVELPLVKFANRLVKSSQNLESSRSDTGLDNTAILCLALARDEPPFFHAIEEARDIRILGDHVFTDATAGQALRFGAAKNAQNIVLGTSEPGGLKKLFGLLTEPIGRLQKGNEDPSFEGNRTGGTG